MKKNEFSSGSFSFFFAKDGNEEIIYNPLTGALGVLEEKDVEALKNGHLEEELHEKGYVLCHEEEEALLNKMYLKYSQHIAKRGKIQLWLLPTYHCNMDCPYCFQGSNHRKGSFITDEVFHKALDYADLLFKEKDEDVRHEVVFSGGEPLLAKNKEKIVHMLDAFSRRRCDIYFTTNGVEAIEYCKDLVKYNCKLQITIDGAKSFHNKTRRLANGEGSFDKIARSIDALLENGIYITLRVNVTRENANSLPELADYILEKGWMGKSCKPYVALVTSKVSGIYKNSVFSRYEFTKKMLNLRRESESFRKVFSMEWWRQVYPILEDYNQGKPRFPIFQFCSACVGGYCLDLYGDVYKCIEMTGNRKYAIGRFYPNLHIDKEKEEMWLKRDVINLPRCKDCKYALMCGGGCALESIKKHGTIREGDCTNVYGIYKEFFNYYLPFLKGEVSLEDL